MTVSRALKTKGSRSSKCKGPEALKSLMICKEVCGWSPKTKGYGGERRPQRLGGSDSTQRVKPAAGG